MTRQSELQKQHEIVVYLAASSPNSKLQEALHGAGFAVHAVNTQDDLLVKVQQVSEPIIFAEIGSNQEQEVEILSALIRLPALHTYPLVAYGDHAEECKDIIQKAFCYVRTLQVKASTVAIVSAAQDCIANYASVRRLVEKVPPPEAPETDAFESTGVDANYKFTDVLFEVLDARGLRDKDFQGIEYAKLHNPERLQSVETVDLEKLEATEDLSLDAHRWSVSHLLRTAFLTGVICRNLEFTEEAQNRGRIASFLLGWSFTEESVTLLRVDYQRKSDRADLARKEICSRIKDSAMKIATGLGDKELAELVSSIAKIIGREQRPADDENGLLASIIAGAECVDRICYQSGFFNSRAAYQFLRRVKTGKSTDIHPLVLACIMKLLSEAIAASPAAVLVPRGIRLDQSKLEQLKQLAAQPASEGETKIHIQDLEPGMRLSQPLRSFDGRELLSPDVTLDSDLIARIWQLAAIRPINHAIITSQEQ